MEEVTDRYDKTNVLLGAIEHGVIIFRRTHTGHRKPLTPLRPFAKVDRPRPWWHACLPPPPPLCRCTMLSARHGEQPTLSLPRRPHGPSHNTYDKLLTKSRQPECVCFSFRVHTVFCLCFVSFCCLRFSGGDGIRSGHGRGGALFAGCGRPRRQAQVYPSRGAR